jgi:hypothetical protein
MQSSGIVGKVGVLANGGKLHSAADVDDGLVTLGACPPGLFQTPYGVWGFKTEYRAMETVGPVDVPGDEIRFRVGRWSECYVVASGEAFWGGVTTHEEREALLVRPRPDALADGVAL